MSKTVYTDEQRTEALDAYRSVGPKVASEQTGIPKATIASWARRMGVHTNVALPEQVAAAHANAAVAGEERRLRLADGLLEDVGQLRDRLFAPMEYVHVKTVGVGAGASQVEQVTVEMDQPTPADQLKLVQAITGLIEKVQLLTGEATSRDEGTGGYDLEQELRSHQAAQAENAAIRRAQETP